MGVSAPDGHGLEEGIGVLPRPQAPQGLVKTEKGILEDLLRVLGVGDDLEDQAEEGPVVVAEEPLEGPLVALTGGLEPFLGAFGLSHRHLPGRTPSLTA